MKLSLYFLCLAATALLTLGGAAQAQDIPAPPAYNIAQRLGTEANAALAAGQPQTAHNRAVQADAEYTQASTSRTYGSGPWGAEALYQEAVVQNAILHDPNAAILTLQRLQNNNRAVPFPDSAKATTLLTTLETQVDRTNSRKPLYQVMAIIVGMFGGKNFSYSYALAILFISVLVRLALTPLSNKQFASMREMQVLQPKVKALQEKYKNDKELQGRKVMELYKDKGVNPASGCLPMLVQLPILYLLYYMIRLYQYQFVHGKFLWIGSPLAHLIPGDVVAPNLGQQDIPLLVLYGLSMYVTQKLTVTPSLDPQQAEQQRMMSVMTPFISTFFFLQWHLPSAFVLYYLIFNILSTVQQKYYMKQRHAGIHGEPEPDDDDDHNPPLLVEDAAKNVRPASNGDSRRGLPARNGPVVPAPKSAANGALSNGAAPTAKGVIAPQKTYSKIHPKKKRR